MIGPLPDPVTGLSIANEMLKKGLTEKNHIIEYIDTNTEKKFTNLSSQGKFSLKKIIQSLLPIMQGIIKISSKKFDVIYITPAQSYLGFLKYSPFIFAAKIKKTPVYIHFHGGFVRDMYDSLTKFKQKILRKIFEKCTGIIVLGSSLEKMFQGIVLKHKVHVCENGVDQAFFLSKNELDDKLVSFNKKNKLEILYLSNLMKSKGILDLLNACLLLKEKGIQFNLNIAGSIEPNLSDEFNYYKELLSEEMTYYGLVKGEKKRKLLKNANIFCLPSYYPNEGQPISILEAMAMGCGIVTTNQGGISDIFKDGVNGIECKKNNAEHLAHSIEKIEEKLNLFSETNVQISYANYTSAHFVNRIEKIISR